MMRRAQAVAVAAALFFPYAAPPPTAAQGLPPSAPPTQHMSAARAQRPPGPMDDFKGLNYTDDQKTKIQLIQKNAQLRKDAVVNDTKLTPEQRDGMLQGLDRIERGQMYQVLTPEQQAEVRKRLVERHKAAAEQQQHASNGPVVSPH